LDISDLIGFGVISILARNGNADFVFKLSFWLALQAREKLSM